MTLIKVGALCTIPLTGIPQTTFGDSSAKVSEQPTAQTELFPRYPKDSICPALTSLFGSTKDLNGAMRMEPGGVDGGRNGDIVISPADGILLAVWKIGTGREVGWNVLIQHDARDLNLPNDESVYYSEIRHLGLDDLRSLSVNQVIKRGQPIGKVNVPGDDSGSTLGVYWEVYEIPNANGTKTEWEKNEEGFDVWRNDEARLLDPLFMMSLQQGKSTAGEVWIQPFTPGNDYSQFRGFSYIFQCKGPPEGN